MNNRFAVFNTILIFNKKRICANLSDENLRQSRLKILNWEFV